MVYRLDKITGESPDFLVQPFFQGRRRKRREKFLQGGRKRFGADEEKTMFYQIQEDKGHAKERARSQKVQADLAVS